MVTDREIHPEPPGEARLRELARELGARMQSGGITLASAESCTGGWLAKIITDIPGSSSWFSASVVSYSNQAKQSLLGVKPGTLETFGAVSAETVKEMVGGVFAHTDADIAVSISGIAGPDGGSDEKPVGLVWFGWGKRDQNMFAENFIFDGNREAVRKQAVAKALEKLLELWL
mgnify:CR=1 FL=1